MLIFLLASSRLWVFDNCASTRALSLIHISLAIALNVYDSLILLRNGVVENSLAESIEPNEDASAWTVTLKDGVKYHDCLLYTSAPYRRHAK